MICFDIFYVGFAWFLEGSGRLLNIGRCVQDYGKFFKIVILF